MKIAPAPVGFVRNDVNDKKDIGWGQDIPEIVIDEKYEKGLIDLKDFPHIIVIYYLDKIKFEINRHLVQRPQGRSDLPVTGILAQRSKDRPNPIGITSVELVKIDKNIITVKGLGAIDTTPVLDIKPYFPMYDCKTDAAVPNWAYVLMKDYF